MGETVMKFLEGFPKEWNLEITEDTNDNVVYSGKYVDMPEKFKNEIVTSFDACEMADGTTDMGIMI